VTRYEGWTDLVPDERSIDGGEQVADHSEGAQLTVRGGGFRLYGDFSLVYFVC
jgi:hypothetical protein